MEMLANDEALTEEKTIMNWYKDCYYQYQNNKLIVGNASIQREWRIDGAQIIPISLKNKINNDEWLTEDENEPMFRLPFFELDDVEDVEVNHEIDDDYEIAQSHLKIEIELHSKAASVKLTIRIYPNKALIRQEVGLKITKPNDMGIADRDKSTVKDNDLLLDANSKHKNEIPHHYVERLPINELHCQWKSVMLRDQTDVNNNLVVEEDGLFYSNEQRFVKGNILFIQKTLSQSGLLLIKESPTPFGQLQYPGHDINMIGKDIYVMGAGIEQNDLYGHEYINMYGTCIGLYEGNSFEAQSTLHDYHHAIHRYIPERDFFMMSNTWGDRNRDSGISEGFILAEIKAAAELGITHYQIDDGWQQGITMNSIIPGGKWGDYYSGEENFWAIHSKKFPRGFEPIIEQANKFGIKLGLWFSPDSSHDFEHWEKDAEIILSFFKKYGICHFKLDGIHITSKMGETNYIRMIRQVVMESKGQVHFNQDTTAEKRLGFFGNIQYGSLFIENRYTDFGNYYPHWTLRNIWKLSWYIPVQKLQMEFLNIERNQHQYDQNDPLSPMNLGSLYAFAVTMIANPLAWMEISRLSTVSQTVLQEAIQMYRNIQKELLSGRIFPLGKEPTGRTWTGFQSIINENEGFLLIFRENNTDNQCLLPLWGDAGKTIQLETLMEMNGRDHLGSTSKNKIHSKQMNDEGKVQFRLEKPNSFILYKYEMK